MTTAPDLPYAGVDGSAQAFAEPYPAEPYSVEALLPAQPAPVRPPLALVPAPADSDTAVIVDFDDAIRRATPRLQRYASRRLQDMHEAEEVVQEALLRAFQHRDELSTEDDLMAWLTVVTGRLVIDRLRVRGRMTPVAELPPGSRTGRDTADVVVARDEARIALDALEAMPSRQAAVLWAREVEGLTYDEIGDRFALSEPTVRSLLHRARQTLRREYSARGGTLPSLGLVALAPWVHGLRIAGRLRDVARRTTGAAALTATGIAVATIAPLWSSPVHAHAQAAPTHPPYVANAAQVQVPAANAVARTAPTTAHPAVVRHITTAATVNHQAPIARVPAVCSDGGGVNCSTPTGSTLFVKLPVTNKDLGVNLDGHSCAALPDTPLTHCDDPTQRTN